MMRSLWQSFTLSFAMYSSIPMPRVNWDEGAMRYVFCFFPAIGIVIGACQLIWFALASRLELLNGLLFAAVSALIPVCLTGGIHLDGFCDTCDALGSHQSRERRLEILKDSHIGAFALIGCCAWFLFDAALWGEAEIAPGSVYVLALIPVLSRSLSGLCSVTMKNARGSGLLADFANASQHRTVRTTLVIWLLLTAAGMLCFGGGLGLAALLGAGIALVYFIRMSRRIFGGITGDLAGWFLQMCELISLTAVVLMQKVSVIL